MMLSEKNPRVASESRKSTKSAMEKRRRARINGSLKELKSILAGIITYKGERFDKMEKADILEMTVQYVRKLQKNNNKGNANDNHDDEEYTSGVNSCLGEVIKYIATNSDCDTNVKTRILDHLAHRINGSQEDAESKMAKTMCSSPPVTRDVQPAIAATDSNHIIIRDSQPSVINANLPSVSSDMHADSNNNCQETPNFNCTRNADLASPTDLHSCNQPLADGAAQFIPVIQPVTQQSSVIQPVAQQPSVIQPLTLIVPANMYSAGMGTTCLVPITLSTSPQQQIINMDSPSYTTHCAIKPVYNNSLTMQRTPPVPISNSTSNCSSRMTPVSPLHVQTSPIVSTDAFTSPSMLSKSQPEVSPSSNVRTDLPMIRCKVVKPIPVNDLKCQGMPQTICKRLGDNINFPECQDSTTTDMNNTFMRSDNDTRNQQFQYGIISQNEPSVRTISQLHSDIVTTGHRMDTTVEHNLKSQCLWRPF